MKHESKKWYNFDDRFYYYKVDESLPDLEYDENNFGIDLYCQEDMIIEPYQDAYVYQNIIIKGNSDIIPWLIPRSSIGKKKLLLNNSIGIIDVKYEGEDDIIIASVWNKINSPVEIKKGERIVQVLFTDRLRRYPCKVKKHWGSENRGGFGSTGA
jgi:dUTP pyrophosphatase